MSSPIELTIRPKMMWPGAVKTDFAYITRIADLKILVPVDRGTCRYTLGPTQNGKTSMAQRAMRELAPKGVHSVYIDLSISDKNATGAESIFQDIATEIMEGLQAQFPDRDRVIAALQQHPIIIRWTKFFLDFLPGRMMADCWVFLDEVNVLTDLPALSILLDAIAQISAEQRRLAGGPMVHFHLLGIDYTAQIETEITNRLGPRAQRMDLVDFIEEQVLQLKPSLADSFAEEEAAEWLRLVYSWTDGHPGLTLRLAIVVADAAAELRGKSAAERSEWLTNEIRKIYLDGKQLLSDPSYEYAARLLRQLSARQEHNKLAREMVSLLADLLAKRGYSWDKHSRTQNALCMSGLAKRVGNQNGGVETLRIRNRLMRWAFNVAWQDVEKSIGADQPDTDPLDPQVDGQR